MRTRKAALVGGLVCLSAATKAQAAWGFNKAATTAATPVESYAPPPVPAPPIDDPIPFRVILTDGPPAPPPLPTNDGSTTYKLGAFTICPSDFVMEAYCLGLIALYTLLSLLDGRANKSHASAWMDANVPTLQDEFAGVGMGDVGKVFTQDGGDEFLTYATGRRGVVSAWTTVQTKARHDIFTRLYHVVRGIMDQTYVSGEDRITIDLKLKSPQGTPGAKFCFAISDRKVLRLLRDSRWDLTTFTTTSETTPDVDSSLIVMSENGEVTKAMLQPETGVLKAVGKGADLTWFESLVITDGPAKQPNESNPSLPPDDFHLILTLGLPPKHRVHETAAWISLACNIADVLYSRPKLLPEVQIPKLKKRRTEALSVFTKALEASRKLSAQEQKEELAARKIKAEKEREEERLRVMSKAERVKYLAKQEELKKKGAMKKLRVRAKQ